MTIKDGQSVFDLATQINGDIRSVVNFCLANDLGFTEDFNSGAEVVSFESDYKNELVGNYFETNSNELATSFPIAEVLSLGIGSMIVESNFKVF